MNCIEYILVMALAIVILWIGYIWWDTHPLTEEEEEHRQTFQL